MRLNDRCSDTNRPEPSGNYMYHLLYNLKYLHFAHVVLLLPQRVYMIHDTNFFSVPKHK